jgi:hypothetical protein
MRELTKYALLANSEIPGIKIISLSHPYIIASVYDYHRDDERVQERMEDMVQGRYPIAKVKGYSIFLTMFTSLEPCNNPELQRAELNEMAQFFLEEKIGHKPGQFAKCEESGRMQEKINKFAERRLRERKRRPNEMAQFVLSERIEKKKD